MIERAAVQPLLTPRLLLRPHDESDLLFMVELNADEDVIRHTGDSSIDEAEAPEVLRYLNRQLATFGIARLLLALRPGGERIGWCGLKWLEDERRVDLGYRLARRYWGHGYATEASRACLDYGFNTLGLDAIIARARPGNGGSVRVLEKLAFAYVRDELQEGATWRLYELTKETWLSTR